MITFGDFLFIQSRTLGMLSAGVDKKNQRRWKSKSKITAEFEKKVPKSLLIDSGHRTEAIISTENRFERYNK
jgi:hypothetical protein